MRKRLVVAALLLAGELLAAEKRLAIPLKWYDIPRDAQVKKQRRAEIPNGYVLYQQYENVYSYSIGFKSGPFCKTTAGGNEVLVLACSADASGYYMLVRNPNKPNAELDWVFDDTPPAKGELH